MDASACARYSNAVSRALSAMLRVSLEKRRRLRGQNALGGSVWNRACSDWMSLRVTTVVPPVPNAPPSVLVSLKSLANVALSSAGGPGARNCAASVIVNGLTFGELRPTGGSDDGTKLPGAPVET